MSLPLLIVVGIGLYTRQHMKSVVEFLLGGRLSGRYLMAVARGEQGPGTVVFVATFEMISKSGFVLSWWNWLNTSIAVLV